MKIPKKYWIKSYKEYEKESQGKTASLNCGYCEYLMQEVGADERELHCSLFPKICDSCSADSARNSLFSKIVTLAAEERLENIKLIFQAIKEDGIKWGYLEE